MTQFVFIAYDGCPRSLKVESSRRTVCSSFNKVSTGSVMMFVVEIEFCWC